jgi:hypothetical protein
MIGRRIARIMIIGLTAVSIVIGCTTTTKITEDIVGRRGSLKKKIAFLPPLNLTGYGDKAFRDASRANLSTFMKRYCEDLIIVDSPEKERLLEKTPRLPSGQIDNLALTQAGRSLGVNAILGETLSDIECVKDQTGIYGFRDLAFFVRLTVRLRGYDPQTGAVLFDEVFRDEVEVGEADWRDIKARKGYQKDIVNQLLIKVSDKMSEKAGEELCSMPWKSYITALSGDTFALPAGEDVGLAEGDVLDVFGMVGTISGPEGQSYMLSGPKIGELRITKVGKHEAKAIGIKGENLQESTHVQLKE